jgi:hypothetical protein
VPKGIEGALERLHQRSVSDTAPEILDEANELKFSESVEHGRVWEPKLCIFIT